MLGPTKTIQGKSYTCYALRSTKGKNTLSSEGLTKCAFDITKAYQIFDNLLSDKYIPLNEEIKGRRYCKCNHLTT